MDKLFTGFLLSAAIGAAHAAPVPIAFTDAVDPNPSHLFDGSGGANDSFTFIHSILDDGYNPGTDIITSASITMRLSDESADAAPESVTFIFDAVSFGTQTIPSGGGTFPSVFFGPSLIGLAADGVVNVMLNNAGITTGATDGRSDFLFLDSTLTINAQRNLVSPPPTEVPEPATLGLVALAMGTGALLRRRQRRFSRPEC